MGVKKTTVSSRPPLGFCAAVPPMGLRVRTCTQGRRGGRGGSSCRRLSPGAWWSDGTQPRLGGPAQRTSHCPPFWGRACCHSGCVSGGFRPHPFQGGWAARSSPEPRAFALPRPSMTHVPHALSVGQGTAGQQPWPWVGRLPFGTEDTSSCSLTVLSDRDAKAELPPRSSVSGQAHTEPAPPGPQFCRGDRTQGMRQAWGRRARPASPDPPPLHRRPHPCSRRDLTQVTFTVESAHLRFQKEAPESSLFL